MSHLDMIYPFKRDRRLGYAFLSITDGIQSNAPQVDVSSAMDPLSTSTDRATLAYCCRYQAMKIMANLTAQNSKIMIMMNSSLDPAVLDSTRVQYTPVIPKGIGDQPYLQNGRVGFDPLEVMFREPPHHGISSTQPLHLTRSRTFSPDRVTRLPTFVADVRLRSKASPLGSYPCPFPTICGGLQG